MSGVLNFFKNATDGFRRVSEEDPLPVKNKSNKPAENVLNLSAVTANVDGDDQINLSNEAAYIVIDITAITGTAPTATFYVEGKDEVSGKYYTILQSADLGAVGTTVLKIGRGFAETANLSANAVLPTTWRVRAVLGGATPSVTATVGADLVG